MLDVQRESRAPGEQVGGGGELEVEGLCGGSAPVSCSGALYATLWKLLPGAR